jgi:hypothetical protein
MMLIQIFYNIAIIDTLIQPIIFKTTIAFLIFSNALQLFVTLDS